MRDSYDCFVCDRINPQFRITFFFAFSHSLRVSMLSSFFVLSFFYIPLVLWSFAWCTSHFRTPKSGGNDRWCARRIETTATFPLECVSLSLYSNCGGLFRQSSRQKSSGVSKRKNKGHYLFLNFFALGFSIVSR